MKESGIFSEFESLMRVDHSEEAQEKIRGAVAKAVCDAFINSRSSSNYDKRADME